jgi:ribosomal protein L40E
MAVALLTSVARSKAVEATFTRGGNMFAPEMTETIGLKQCHTCGAELLERDKFCRRCGVNQSLCAAPLTVVAGQGVRFEYETRPLPGGPNSGGSFSGTLVNFVTQSVSERTSRCGANRWTMRLVGALVMAPLWVMIVMLAPLDAYVAAKAIAKLC